MTSDRFERLIPIETVLILDDDQDDLGISRDACRPRATFATTSVNEAFELARTMQPKLAVIDLWLGPQEGTEALARSWRRDVFGIDVIRQLRDEHENMIIVLFSRSVSKAHHSAAKAAGANGAVPKLFGPQKLLMIIEGGHLEGYPFPFPSPPSLNWMVHDYIAERYLANGRNAAATARELGISMPTLFKKLRGSVPDR